MNQEPNKYITVSFCFQDQYGNETNLMQTLEDTYCSMSELEIINNSYKNFLNACGFYTEGKEVVLIDEDDI